MTADDYPFGEDRGRESERLDAVEQAFDAPSRAALREAGVPNGWRCWEVIAGPPVTIAFGRRPAGSRPAAVPG